MHTNMDLQSLNPTNPTFEPGRPVYVLLHSDESHIYSNPDGGPSWSYERQQMELIRTILRKDFKNNDYHIVTLAVAWPRICNKQAELEEVWAKAIDKIRRIKGLADRRNYYRNFFHRHKLPHPISADAELKKLLSYEV